MNTLEKTTKCPWRFLSLHLILFLFVWVGAAAASQQVAQVPFPGASIPKYVDPLPVFGPGTRATGTSLTVTMEEFQQYVLPSSLYVLDPLNPPAAGVDPTKGTYVWGYKVIDGATVYGPLYPGFTVEAQRGIPTTITYVNNLTGPGGGPPILQKYLTVDQTLHWADPLNLHCEMNPAAAGCFTPYAGPVPAVAHLHGGEVPSAFDGGPDQWFTPTGLSGPGYTTLGSPPAGSAIYRYPNAQEAATLWFHDHALGTTRMNVYGGLAAFYLLRDAASLDTGLSAPGGLPAGHYEIEMAIQDRMFDTNGQFIYPDAGDNLDVHPFWIPEFFGDVIVVNGKSWPYLQVEPRRYRLRIVNGSNARFYDMFLENRVTETPGPVFWQIGTDGGLLDTPALIDPNHPVDPTRLVLGPGERADLIVDFSNFAGQTLTLRNLARSPYPKGGTPDPQTTGQIMQFRVDLPLTGSDDSFDPAVAGAGSLRPGDPIVDVDPAVTGIVDLTRQLTLNENMGAFGPLEALLNNTKWDGNGADPGLGTTERPVIGSTELWQVVNLTGDAHPIHLHLAQFQLVSRQKFNVNRYNRAYAAAFGGLYVPAVGPPLPYDTPNADGAVGGNPAISPYLQGPAVPAPAHEAGWKDTVVMLPGEVTTIAVRWAPQDVPAGTVSAGENWYPFDPTLSMFSNPGAVDEEGNPAGPGYVWHCHILDHEDNEMMRPLSVRAE